MFRIRRPRLKKPVFTCSLVTANVLAYAVLALLSGNFLVLGDDTVSLVGQWNVMVLERAAYWQLFSAMFVHFNLLHLLVNMLFLAEVGAGLERHLGGKKFVITYLTSGFVGNLMTLCLKPETLSAGSSGAILGIYSALLMVSESNINNPNRRALIKLAVLFLLNSVLPGVNVMSHLGGVATGALSGYFDARRRVSRIEHPVR